MSDTSRHSSSSSASRPGESAEKLAKKMGDLFKRSNSNLLLDTGKPKAAAAAAVSGSSKSESPVIGVAAASSVKSEPVATPADSKMSAVTKTVESGKPSKSETGPGLLLLHLNNF